MKRFRLFLRFENEEKWLEQMAGQGWMLFRKSFFYHFRKVTPKTGTVRIDYREMRFKKDFLDYCTLFEVIGLPSKRFRNSAPLWSNRSISIW